MSGSNKFSNIKRRKGAQDAQRSRIYSRLSQEIAVAVKAGGSNPADNAALRVILQKARGQNMPGASIQRALQRGGSSCADALRPAVYEAIGPKGTALMIDVLTDNGNRSTSFVRSALNRVGGELTRSGSVRHLFEVQGHFECGVLPDPDTLALALMDEGLEDYVVEDGRVRFITSRDAFGRVQAALTDAGVAPESAELRRVCRTPRPVDAGTWAALNKLVDVLMGHDDVSRVVHDAVLI